jgi:hypothetical protein
MNNIFYDVYISTGIIYRLTLGNERNREEEHLDEAADPITSTV